MYSHLIFGFLPALAIAAPFVENSNPNNEVAESFAERAAFPGQAAQSGWSIFRRQGCPNLSLLCPSGTCCSYATEVTSCCGKNCCAAGYLCTGGTASNPCCVAITSPTNTCGSVNTNPCSTPGYLPCSGANFCCPPNSLCYVDSFNVARCSPKTTSTSSTTSTRTPTPTTTRSFSSTTTTTTTTPTTTPTSTQSFSSTSTTTKTTSTTTVTQSSTSSSTTSSIDPNPTPLNSNDGSSSSPAPSNPHNDRGFWTPAAIGGVAGGGAAALILVLVLICCCVRKCCVGRSGSNGDHNHVQRWTTPWTPPRIQPLSDHEIAALVRYRDTTQAWQAMYVIEGTRIEGHDHIDRVAWLEDFATRAVQQRHYQLRNGGGQLLTHIICGAIGWIPGAKLVVGPWSTLEFTKYALKCFGMFEKEDLNELYRKACSKAGIVTNLADFINKLEKKGKEAGGPKWLFKKTVKEIGKDEDVQAEMLNQLNDYLQSEMTPEAAAAAMEEVVNFIPWLGHAYGAYRGIDKSNTRINKALDYLKEEALDFHLKVFVVNAY